MIPFRDNIASRHYPLMTLMVILANVAVFFYELSLPAKNLQEFIFLRGVVPAQWQLVGRYPVEILTDLFSSIFSSLFLHAGWVHLFGNMWYLWIFGDNVENRMGSFRFLIFLPGLRDLSQLFTYPLQLQQPTAQSWCQWSSSRRPGSLLGQLSIC